MLYFVGAALGARIEWSLGLLSLLAPAAASGCAVVVDQLRPLSLQTRRKRSGAELEKHAAISIQPALLRMALVNSRAC
jgi:hypothetical protein